MKQFVLVAGFDYEFTGVDFRQLCENRRKRIITANKAREELRFTILDFRAGETVEIAVTYPGGVKQEAKKQTATFRPVGRSSYHTVTAPDGTTHVRFKPGQFDTLSILDMYGAVVAIGTNAPGTLAELSVFSHAWAGGPILVNSDNDRSVVVPAPPSIGGGGGTVTVALGSTTLRDPDDRDPRVELDFVPPTMDAGDRALFAKAFAKDALVWLWGCQATEAVHNVLNRLERSKEYRITGLGDEDEVTLTNLAPKSVDFLEAVLLPLLKATFPKPRSTVTLKFKFVKFFACAANRMSYAAHIADVAKVETRAAPMGTGANYDGGALPLMHVDPVYAAHFTFYRNYLNRKFDPDGRNYMIFVPGEGCAKPKKTTP
ncbi:hypothetical protein [Streptodolium elevatio]|uniref:Uncharacterized protein n=1 Tax=Streptodolium elevatio TaxID=3157996 RepID=A0ABV3DDR5_9ACTN